MKLCRCAPKFWYERGADNNYIEGAFQTPEDFDPLLPSTNFLRISAANFNSSRKIVSHIDSFFYWTDSRVIEDTSLSNTQPPVINMRISLSTALKLPKFDSNDDINFTTSSHHPHFSSAIIYRFKTISWVSWGYLCWCRDARSSDRSTASGLLNRWSIPDYWNLDRLMALLRWESIDQFHSVATRWSNRRRGSSVSALRQVTRFASSGAV